jgi:hypothetical protein
MAQIYVGLPRDLYLRLAACLSEPHDDEGGARAQVRGTGSPHSRA